MPSDPFVGKEHSGTASIDAKIARVTHDQFDFRSTCFILLSQKFKETGCVDHDFVVGACPEGLRQMDALAIGENKNLNFNTTPLLFS
jgi:hypothetical protein